MSAPAPILKKVRLLKLKLRQRVKDLFAGGYQSAFKGQGMIFTDYRKYVPGDDVRTISWPLTAKMGEPYIKIFEEEKGATFLLAMDVSGSFDFGTKEFKGESACELASLIAFSAQRNQDRVGLLLFSDRVEHYVPPTHGLNNVSRLVRDMYSFQRKSTKTDFIPALNFLNHVLKKHCHIFLFSDFFTSGDFTRPLQIIRRRHDVVVGIVRDPFETRLPSLGLLELEDTETGKRMIVDTSSRTFMKQYAEQMQQQKEKMEKSLLRSKVDYFYIDTSKDLFKQLLGFIQRRRRR